MGKIIDLSKGYVPVMLVVAMLVSCITASFWLDRMANSVQNNTKEIIKISESLEVLPEMNIDLALIKHELGIDSKETALGPYRNNE